MSFQFFLRMGFCCKLCPGLPSRAGGGFRRSHDCCTGAPRVLLKSHGKYKVWKNEVNVGKGAKKGKCGLLTIQGQHSAFDLFWKFTNVQSCASSPAKHGDAYFSAVYGSIKDPITAPGPYENQ